MLVQPLTSKHFDNRIDSIGLVGLYLKIKLHLNYEFIIMNYELLRPPSFVVLIMEDRTRISSLQSAIMLSNWAWVM